MTRPGETVLERTSAHPDGHARNGVREWSGTAGVVATLLFLGAGAAIPVWADRATAATAAGVVLGVGLLVVAVAVWRSSALAGRRLPVAGELVLHLSPVLLLSTVFPLVSGRMADASVGGVQLTGVVLASSLTVPWLSQAVCMPLYRGIGDSLHAGDRAALRDRFCAVWPLVALRALPVVALFAVPVQLATGWSFAALGAYLLLSVFHVLFAQMLVLTNAPGQRRMWALAWTAYTVALAVAPTVWWLPVTAGILVQALPLRRSLRALTQPVRLDGRDVGADFVRGLLLGSVLWADKLLFFLVAGNRFAVDTVFLALMPAVLAYNLYFVLLAPAFDRSVQQLRRAMEDEPIDRLHLHSAALWRTVCSSILRTALVGAVLSFVVTGFVAAVSPRAAVLSAAVSVASWAFMMTTVVCYKLDYIGQQRPAQLLSAVHLVACTAAFALLPAGALVYVVLAVVEAGVLVAALRSCLRHWRLPEYTLFWRHATSW